VDPAAKVDPADLLRRAAPAVAALAAPVAVVLAAADRAATPDRVARAIRASDLLLPRLTPASVVAAAKADPVDKVALAALVDPADKADPVDKVALAALVDPADKVAPVALVALVDKVALADRADLSKVSSSKPRSRRS
jgi:hypothetical protein